MEQLARAVEALRDTDDRFRQLAETIEVVFWMTTPDKNELLYLSPAYERIWGRPCAEAYAAPHQWLDAIHPEDRPGIQQQALSQREGTGYDVQYRIVRADGAIRWIHDRAFLVRDAEGKPSRIVGLAEDITPRKLAEIEIVELRAELERRVAERTSELAATLSRGRALIEALPDRMYRLGRDGVILESHVPTGSFTLLPHPSAPAAGLTDLPLPEGFKDTFYLSLERALETGEMQTLQYVLETQSGRRYLESRLARSGHDEVVATIRDVTPTLEAQEEQHRLEDQLRQSQKLEAIGTLAGGIAHDFNNILAAILGHADLLDRKLADRPDARESLHRITRAGERARDLIRQILVFSRPHDQSLERTRLHATFEEALKLLRAAIPSTIDITADIDPNTPAVMADSTQLHQVLFNLATNGLAALNEAGGRLTVRYGPVNLGPADLSRYAGLKPGPHVRLVVTDNGRGMEPVVRDRIFEPFFTTRGEHGGSGLGLAIVHGIVRGHGGAIHVESRPGGGSSFSVILPVAPPPGPRAAGDAARTGGLEACVMVVDDEEAVGELVELMLEPIGCVIVRYSSPLRALEAFSDGPQGVDLLVTDLTMPGLNGLELARRMRELRPDLPVIVMTGYSGTLTEEQTRAAGAQEWLSKPFTADDLTDAVERTLRHLVRPRPV